MVHLAGAESFGATAYWGAYHSRCPFDQCQNRASRMIIGMGTPNNQSRIPRSIFPPMDGRKRALVIIVTAVRRRRTDSNSLLLPGAARCVSIKPRESSSRKPSPFHKMTERHERANAVADDL